MKFGFVQGIKQGEIAPTPVDPGHVYTGSVDRIGLAAIGWTEEDIDFLQKSVCWDEEYNDRYLVPQTNIDLYTNKIINEHCSAYEIEMAIIDNPDIMFLPKVSVYPSNNTITSLSKCNIVGIPSLYKGEFGDLGHIGTYLNNTGNGTVLTDYIPKYGDRIVFIIDVDTTSGAFSYGCRLDSPNNGFHFFYDETTSFMAYGGSTTQLPFPVISGKMIADFSPNKYILNGIEYSYTTKQQDGVVPISIGGCNTNGVIDSRRQPGQYYQLKVYRDGNVIHNYLPFYLKDETATNRNAFIDTVTNNVFTPVGTFTFAKSMGYLFYNYQSVITIPNLEFYEEDNFNLSSLFKYCYNLIEAPYFDIYNTNNMNDTFAYCISLKNIPNYNTSNISTFVGTFYRCHSLETIPNLNFNSCTSMSNMFNGAYSLKKIPDIDVPLTCNITSTFHSCASLEYIGFKFQMVNNIAYSFYYCRNLKKLPSFKLLLSSTPYTYFMDGAIEINEFPIIYDEPINIPGIMTSTNNINKLEYIKQPLKINSNLLSTLTLNHNLKEIGVLDYSNYTTTTTFNSYVLREVRIKNTTSPILIKSSIISADSLIYISENNEVGEISLDSSVVNSKNEAVRNAVLGLMEKGWVVNEL